MVVSAQNVVTFLGIPVDGTESSMKAKLKEKGFQVQSDGSLTGEFNGFDIALAIVTTYGKVSRIVVGFPPVKESDIKVNYNTLFQQFKGNSKYTVHPTCTEIPDSEDIGYEILVHNKRYDATFYQEGDPYRCVWFTIFEKYGKYSIILFYDNEHNRAQGSDL